MWNFLFCTLPFPCTLGGRYAEVYEQFPSPVPPVDFTLDYCQAHMADLTEPLSLTELLMGQTPFPPTACISGSGTNQISWSS